ncbi:methionyl-tRNA formyltransferase [Kiloniella spongiae]|uniref:Methionyl-tRNA formyltransferase n=1 Tax=Kiloniella spongiae TaxID=1489064 RepID=A0A0H2N0L3_9PROT|nr:methionyl-tRNA formyltransferase [Kiloniella spongiae]KLN62415.1 methionyl-tRNA formyltransferase [Kiloniella spongiae]
MKPLRIVFMGTPDFSVPCLRSLAENGHEIVAVYSQPPRPAGRGQKEKRSPVHTFAVDQGWPVFTPKTFRNSEVQDSFREHNADVAVVVAYGLILPTEALYAPKMGCINVHASLLPRWRGAAPIQRAIEAGDQQSGVCIMQMVEELDAGDIILEGRVDITSATTASSLHDALSALGGKLIVKALDGLESGYLAPTPQPEDGITYAKKLSRDESELDWAQPAQNLERKVRALTPWPGVHFTYQGDRFKVQEVSFVEKPQAALPGTLIDDDLLVACGENALRIERLQRPGKGMMDRQAFLNGFPLKKGTNLAQTCEAQDL